MNAQDQLARYPAPGQHPQRVLGRILVAIMLAAIVFVVVNWWLGRQGTKAPPMPMPTPMAQDHGEQPPPDYAAYRERSLWAFWHVPPKAMHCAEGQQPTAHTLGHGLAMWRCEVAQP